MRRLGGTTWPQTSAVARESLVEGTRFVVAEPGVVARFRLVPILAVLAAWGGQDRTQRQTRAADLDGDGLPDPCEHKRGDFDLDDFTGGADLAILLSEWGFGGGPADIDDDNYVTGADLSILLSNWGPH